VLRSDTQNVNVFVTTVQHASAFLRASNKPDRLCRPEPCQHGVYVLLSHALSWPLMCVLYRETLRRDPVVGAVMRVSTQEFQLGDYYVPPSQTFLLPLRELASHDPRWEGKQGGAASNLAHHVCM